MQIATLAIAACGLPLSLASLAWQAATYYLNGGRVKIELHRGALGRAGMATGKVSARLSSRTLDALASEGFERPILGVQVRNVGRGDVTITRWSIFATPDGTAFNPVGESIGPPLPHRLAAGESQIWAVDFRAADALRFATANLLKLPPNDLIIRGRVELGTGKVKITRERLKAD